MDRRDRFALTLLRIAVASLLFAHGVARLASGAVGEFGDFLGGWGIPSSHALAWIVTVTELAGGLVLAAGYLVLPLCAWFGIVLLLGTLLVHAPEGWFVVGIGRNGMEYNVLLIVCLLTVALTHREALRLRRRRRY